MIGRMFCVVSVVSGVGEVCVGGPGVASGVSLRSLYLECHLDTKA